MSSVAAIAMPLFAGEIVPLALPVADHYAGSVKFADKAIALQQEMAVNGHALFDITLDLEDGAAVGQEAELADAFGKLIASGSNTLGRIGVRVHPPHHPAFIEDLQRLLGTAGDRLAYLMLPKLNSASDLANAVDAIDRVAAQCGLRRQIPVHSLIETHGGLREVFRIAAHPRVQSLSFGLMDFVSGHHGAIPASAMRSPGQFEHPLVLRAKTEIAAACHAYGKVPSHNVTTEIRDTSMVAGDAQRARNELAYLRMWSIHPDQIKPIIKAFTPLASEVNDAGEILSAAESIDWAPIEHKGKLHDRASYRYFWTILQRAARTGVNLPEGSRKLVESHAKELTT